MSDITDIGWCPACRRNVLDHPTLQCPWCSSASPVGARRTLGLSPDADPVETLIAVSEHIDELVRQLRSAKTLRATAARRALAGDLPAVAEQVHVRVATIEKWAQGSVGPKCSKGHLRAEHGVWDGQRWTCTKCAADRPPKRPKKPPNPRKVRVRNAWAAHERRMAERQRLADAGQLPDRLNEPMEPPVPRRRLG